MLILAVLLNVWGQLHTLFRRYIRPGISCYRRRGRFNEFIESDTDKAWIKFTSAISISLRPNAARETSDRNSSATNFANLAEERRASDFKDHFEEAKRRLRDGGGGGKRGARELKSENCLERQVRGSRA